MLLAPRPPPPLGPACDGARRAVSFADHRARRGDQGAPETEVLGVPQEPGDCQHQGPRDRADTGTPGGDAGRHGHGEVAGEEGGEAGHGGQ